MPSIKSIISTSDGRKHEHRFENPEEKDMSKLYADIAQSLASGEGAIVLPNQRGLLGAIAPPYPLSIYNVQHVVSVHEEILP